jgi:ribonuclease R
VTLDELFIEGLVHVTELGADYFQYDDARHELRAERTGKRYQLTDRVTVQVSRVDLEARKIDLRLVTEDGLAIPGKAAAKKDGRTADSGTAHKTHDKASVKGAKPDMSRAQPAKAAKSIKANKTRSAAKTAKTTSTVGSARTGASKSFTKSGMKKR